MSKCHFSKNCFIENALRYGCSPVNLLHMFRVPLYKNTSGGLLLSEQKQRNERKNQRFRTMSKINHETFLAEFCGGIQLKQALNSDDNRNYSNHQIHFEVVGSNQ